LHHFQQAAQYNRTPEVENWIDRAKRMPCTITVNLYGNTDKFDKVHLLCVEEKLSLLQRYKLRQLIKSEKARKRVQDFSEFIKKFPECDADPEAVYEQIVEKIYSPIRKK